MFRFSGTERLKAILLEWVFLQYYPFIYEAWRSFKLDHTNRVAKPTLCGAYGVIVSC